MTDRPEGRTVTAGDRKRRRRIALLAFAWGLAEAVIFFIVPDVLLTRIALTDLRRALVACVWTTIGALIGGSLLFLAAAHGNAPALLHVYAWLPGISNDLLVRTAQAVHTQGAFAMLPGALQGQPYKLFAVHASPAGVTFGPFILYSIVSRVARFGAASVVAAVIGRLLPSQPARRLGQLHTLFWIVFYTWYFIAMR
jgi:membrane protein YqaA with SNARE-associated domain